VLMDQEWHVQVRVTSNNQLTCNTNSFRWFNIHFKISYSNRKLQDSTVQDTN